MSYSKQQLSMLPQKQYFICNQYSLSQFFYLSVWFLLEKKFSPYVCIGKPYIRNVSTYALHGGRSYVNI